jgi:hypothetical protein
LAKRAELAGELIAAEKRIAQIHLDLAAVDGALRVFDPTTVPVKIKPRRPMSAPLTPLPHGHASRVILTILREATEPLSARQIAEALAERCGMTDPSPAQRKALTDKVLSVLIRKGSHVVIREERREGAVWRVA